MRCIIYNIMYTYRCVLATCICACIFCESELVCLMTLGCIIRLSLICIRLLCLHLLHVWQSRAENEHYFVTKLILIASLLSKHFISELSLRAGLIHAA